MRLKLKRILPNLLTTIRFILVIPLVAFLHLAHKTPNNLWLSSALFLFLLAVLTDKLDGVIARNYDTITDYGKLMDPLADKLLVLSSLVMLTQLGLVPGWITIIILTRSLLVTGLRGYASSKDVVISASSLGKYKTLLQVTSITLILLGTLEIHPYLGKLGFIVLLLATALTAYSGLDYFTSYFYGRES